MIAVATYAMTTNLPMPVPAAPTAVPVSVVMIPAESIHRIESTLMHVLTGTYVKFHAFHRGLTAEGGLAIPSARLYLRIQANDETAVRMDICTRVLSINDIDHGFAAMVMSMVGVPSAVDAFALEANGTIPEWSIPAKPGVPIHVDGANTVHVRLEAYIHGGLSASTRIVYTLEPLPKVTT